MKKLVMITVMLFTVVAFAQQGPRREMSKKSPKEMAAEQTKKMTAELELDEAQATKVEALVLTQATKMQEKRKEMMAAGERPSPEQREAMRAEMLKERKAMKAEMKEILTKDQFKKWSSMVAEQTQERGRGRKRRN